MKVLVVGSGGREHALAWKLSKSSLVSEIFVAPGNGGTEIEESIQNIAIDSNDIEGLSDFAKKSGIDLTIVGPEDPLVNGITDKFQDEGLLCFGPSKDAARLEGSKEFMNEDERKYIVNELSVVDNVFLSIDEDNSVVESILKIYNIYSNDYDILFGNGGDQTNDNIPEKSVCEKLNIKLIDGLGEKIQSSSWLIKKNEN